jgi:NAD-dependent dihydropyrimidine dehydrogenase PreA subunit
MDKDESVVKKQEWTLDQVKKMVGAAIDYYPKGSQATGVVIPVNKEIKAEQRILNFWYVEELLKKSDIIAHGECGCRKKLKKCDHTLDGCLFLNYWGEEAIKEGYARKTNFREALTILKKTYTEGLVLVAGGEDPPVKICSCCSCCCFLFAGLQRFNLENALVHSDYIARVDKTVCDECATCVSRCHFGAMRQREKKVIFNKDNCFGCGLCIATCPNGAIELLRR